MDGWRNGQTGAQLHAWPLIATGVRVWCVCEVGAVGGTAYLGRSFLFVC